MTITKSLQVKRLLRKKTPRFSRHAYHRKSSLQDNWRKPRGLHNKQRDNKKGSFPRVSDGYRTPVSIRGMHISGYEIVHVSNLQQLQGLNPKTQAVVVASIGARNQLVILEACLQRKIKVLNHKPEQRIDALKTRRTVTKAAAEANKKAKDSRDKKEKKAVEEKLSEEEKKQQQEKLKEEVLTKGQ